MPLKVDPLTLQRQTLLYSRVLLDVDCLVGLPSKLLVQRKSIGVKFYINITYENPPHFCEHCSTIRHILGSIEEDQRM